MKSRAWERSHSEEMRTYRRRWNQRNRATKLAIQRTWRAANPEKVRLYNERRRRKYHEQQRGLRSSWRLNGYPEPTRPAPATCECCGSAPGGKGNRLHIDHDHATGTFRGWLCHRCNLGIGSLGDNVEGLERALAYLLGEVGHAEPSGRFAVSSSRRPSSRRSFAIRR